MKKGFKPDANTFNRVNAKERADSHMYSGRTTFGKAKLQKDDQLNLF